MNEQCKKCHYRMINTPVCNIKSNEKGDYIRVDNATEKCNYYIEVERED